MPFCPGPRPQANPIRKLQIIPYFTTNWTCADITIFYRSSRHFRRMKPLRWKKNVVPFSLFNSILIFWLLNPLQFFFCIFTQSVQTESDKKCASVRGGCGVCVHGCYSFAYLYYKVAGGAVHKVRRMRGQSANPAKIDLKTMPQRSWRQWQASSK